MNVETLKKVCKNASRAFFNVFGLISHQINSFSQLSEYLNKRVMKSGFDWSKREGCDWSHVTITYGKVRGEDFNM